MAGCASPASTEPPADESDVREDRSLAACKREIAPVYAETIGDPGGALALAADPAVIRVSSPAEGER